MGPLFFGLIILIAICGDEVQKSELVDALVWNHPNILHSIAFWAIFAYLAINYGFQRHKRKNHSKE